MSKYEYAYYDSERRLIAVADIREESKKDPHIYMQRYEGHLLCPECKQARLIVVQGADFPFFRAAPRSAHRDGCDFIRPEYVPTATDAQNPANAKTIRSQLRRALAKTLNAKLLVLSTPVETVRLIISRKMKDLWHRSCSVAKLPSV